MTPADAAARARALDDQAEAAASELSAGIRALLPLARRVPILRTEADELTREHPETPRRFRNLGFDVGLLEGMAAQLEADLAHAREETAR